MSRTQLAVFLAGIAVAVSGPALADRALERFPDVPAHAYYASAVGMLAEQGIIRGYDDGAFGPDDVVTRGQVAVILQRYDRTVVEPLRQQLSAIRAQAGLGACGDGRVQVGEACDDGNTTDGDGCSSYCLAEALATCPGGHRAGESFVAEDGCNTCFCDESGNVTCTLRGCLPDPVEAVCFSSADCQPDQICTTEQGECRSPCPPGVACIQACSGLCVQRPADDRCQPHVCEDGSQHPSCTEDGHPINYFADPCLTHESSCTERKRVYEGLLDGGRSCETDEDCVVFEHSCPYVTCGEAVNRATAEKLRDHVPGLVTACEEDGPLPCAACLAIHAVCENSVCTAKEGFGVQDEQCATYVRNGEKQTYCATCGDGVCSAYEGCTSSNCTADGICTSDCGQLYCPDDCDG